jgi:4-hydroxy-tetrahydrodipicolinate synthase
MYMNRTIWKGVFSAVTTKFKPDFSLDIDRMEAHFNEQIEAGIHGFVVTGSLGENAALTIPEKLEVLNTAIRVSNGRIPVLAGVAETTAAAEISVIEQAVKLGADGFMVLPAMRYPAEPQEAMQHFRAVAEACPLPIMIYNNPVAYKVDITPQMFAELADESTFIALKESSDNVRRVTDIINTCGDRYQLFTGVDNIALESLVMGATGWVAGLVCAFPRETVAIYNLVQEGKIEEARTIYRWFRPLLDLDVTPRFVHYIKYTEAVVSGHANDAIVREPRYPMPEAERAHIESIVRHALETRVSA